jgi:hypothetical protein
MHNARPFIGWCRAGPRDGGGSKKAVGQGVDGREMGCMMCGSLGHFGDEAGTRR